MNPPACALMPPKANALNAALAIRTILTAPRIAVALPSAPTADHGLAEGFEAIQTRHSNNDNWTGYEDFICCIFTSWSCARALRYHSATGVASACVNQQIMSQHQRCGRFAVRLAVVKWCYGLMLAAADYARRLEMVWSCTKRRFQWRRIFPTARHRR